MRSLRLLVIALLALASGRVLAVSPIAHLLSHEKPATSEDGDAKQQQNVSSKFLSMCLEHFVRGELFSAEQDCGLAILANPHEVDAYKLRGYAYLLSHRFDLAKSDFQAGLHLRPHDAQIISGYGQSLSGLGKFSEAASQFRQALAISPRYAAYWNGLCWALAGNGQNLEKALAACNFALKLAPHAAGVLNSRAIVYLLLHRYTLAIADYNNSLSAQTNQASAWFGRGLARLWRGEKDGVSDIIEARLRDPAVDYIFIQMKVLAENCPQSSKRNCPEGFPPLEHESRGNNQVALLHADPDQELAAGIKSLITRQN